MANKPKPSKPAEKSKKPVVKKAAVKKHVQVKRSIVKKGATVKKQSVIKRRGTAKPSTGEVQSLRDRMLVQINAMSSTLDEESLKKLLQDAAILAHNERVLKDFAMMKEQAGPRPAPVTAAVEEGKDGSFFIIILKGYRHIFGLDEMRDLVRVCHNASNAGAAGPRLYAWMEQRRRDILKNSKIAEDKDPCLPALWEKIVSTYDAKG
jgi:hypothetical protein